MKVFIKNWGFKEQNLWVYALSCFRSPCFVPKCLCRLKSTDKNKKRNIFTRSACKKMQGSSIVVLHRPLFTLKREGKSKIATALIFKECSFRSALFSLFFFSFHFCFRFRVLLFSLINDGKIMKEILSLSLINMSEACGYLASISTENYCPSEINYTVTLEFL